MTANVPFPFIHHVTLLVGDFKASERFYAAALAPLDVSIEAYEGNAAELWRSDADTPSFGMYTAPTPEEATRGLHIAFTARSRAEVDAFHQAALANGGTEREAPRRWPEYGAYCAFVNDPDGNNVEAVFKEPQGEQGE
ncbi:VOC family protein [Streptomyces sp. KLOTTS4A1]|uniref:VOC family protein n=1 Tax=Streptomyces sp. KLOTTS4A1 TaxID=3390996 RepID=UPI0039F53801